MDFVSLVDEAVVNNGKDDSLLDRLDFISSFIQDGYFIV